MALVENHHNSFISNILQLIVIVIFCYSSIKFLNRSNDDFTISGESFDKLACIVGVINSARFKSFIFRLSLSVEVMTVNNKHNFIYTINIRNQLRGIKRSQGFTCTSCMPNISVLISISNSIENTLNGIVLVRTEHHQTLIPLMQYDVLTNHFAQHALIKEHCGKKTQVIEWIIFGISPIKRELITGVGIVCEISSVNAIRDYK